MFGDKLYALRTAKGMSQEELARLLCKSKQSVSNWENNTVMPAVEVLVQICKMFNVSCDYLLDLESSNTLNADGLTDEQLLHLQLLINDLRELNYTK